MARGELRIYVGAAPGVGKTYAMLNEGWRRRKRGVDVVVGLVETHGRQYTAQQLRDLEVVPRRRLIYRDQPFEEMDIDALLARRPDVALVDELAHTNVPGSRNAKRWQDVEELLAAGIDVISTVNVQHLESLNDVVEHITGITQRETVPDAFVRAADQIELVDMTPQALRRRLAHGNVYDAEKVDAALANYFREGNLAALRELALLWVADRVDEGLEDYRERHGISAQWETRERVLVALTGAPGGDRLVRRGARLAAKGRAELIGVHVGGTDGLVTPGSDLERDRRLLAELGGRFIEVVGDDVAQALTDVARAENATQIVLGATRRSWWKELTRGSVINRVIALAGSTDVHVISADPGRDAPERRATRRGSVAWSRPSRRQLQGWVMALLGIPVLAVALVPLDEQMGSAGSLMILMLGPIAVALVGGLRPALAASVVAFVAADWYYIPPTGTLRIDRAGDAVTLVVFVLVATLVSVLVDRLANRTGQLAHSRAESEALARLAQQAVLLDDTAQERLVSELRTALRVDAVAVLQGDGTGWQVSAASGRPVPARPDAAAYSADLADGTVLVIAGPALQASEQLLLSSFVAHLRLARETLVLRQRAASASLLTEATGLNDALMVALDRRVRTPLAEIAASTAALRRTGSPATDDDHAAAAIEQAVGGLEAVLDEMMLLHRLQTRALAPHMAPVPLDDAVPRAVADLGDSSGCVEVSVVPGLPPAEADPLLLQAVLTIVIRNAIRWCPAGTPVRVEGAAVAGQLDVRVVDRGPGIPRNRRDAMLHPPPPDADGGADPGTGGLGLGLALANSFAEAMGAHLTIGDTPGGGTTVTLSLRTGQGGRPADAVASGAGAATPPNGRP